MTTEVEAPAGQRQKEYRASMRSKGFVCKQLWIPADKVDEIEEMILDLRKSVVVEDEDDLI